ncbi:hypothetical protein ANTQUA_LOCUS433 [Anthophora quadrimaculata]
MRSRLFILLCVLCCCLLVSGKRVKVEGKEFDVKPYPEDCSKYLLCRKGVCNLTNCQYTYVFDPVTGTCTHRSRGNINCDRRSSKKYSFP